MPEPDFQSFVFDEQNEEKFWEHGLTTRQVASMLFGYDFEVRRNRNERSGLYLLIGRDSSGNCIAVPVSLTGEQATWRPVTAWYCKSSEERQL